MQVVDLKPDWPKGYSRLGAANQGLGNWDDAVEAYRTGKDLQLCLQGWKSQTLNVKFVKEEAQASLRHFARFKGAGPLLQLHMQRSNYCC